MHSHRNTHTHGCCTGYKRMPMANSHRNSPDLASQLDHLPLSSNTRLLTWPTGTLANRPRHLCSAVSLCVHPHLLCIPPGGRMESNGGVGHPLSAPLISEKGQLKVGCSPFTAGNTGRASCSDPVSQQSPSTYSWHRVACEAAEGGSQGLDWAPQEFLVCVVSFVLCGCGCPQAP